MANSTYTPDEQPAVQKSATPARQGMWGRHVLWVLIVSFVLAAIALFGSWALRSGQLASVEDTRFESKVEAQNFNMPEPAPRQ